ncbi:MAG: hypothetical protein P8R37_05970 [Opitutae bacterium]|nr:hypothetical protein [Opitutae bacterium]
MLQPSSLQVSKTSVLATKRKFSNALFDRVVKNLIHGSDTHPAIEKEGISKSLFYLELTKRPELAHRFKDAQYQRDKVRNAKRIESAEAELHRRGVDGWDEPVFDIKGNHCGDKRRFSDACLIFMLKSLKPEVFADKPQALVQTNVSISNKSEAEILAGWRVQLGAAPDPAGGTTSVSSASE